MNKTKRVIVILLVTVSMFAFSGTTANASIYGGTYYGYKQMSHNGSYSYTSFNVTIRFPNKWYYNNLVTQKGFATIKWMGLNPVKADSIELTDTVSVTSIGGISISGSGGGFSLNGSTVKKRMYDVNAWQINSNFDLSIKAPLILTSDFSASGTVKIGSNFYSMSCTT